MTDNRLAILVDFDDTAAQQNVAETLLKTFGGNNWEGYREDFRNGSMNLRYYQEKAFNEIDATLEEMGEAIGGLAWMRPGFVDFPAGRFVPTRRICGLQPILLVAGVIGRVPRGPAWSVN
mgnify:CR=1 FL=1